MNYSSRRNPRESGVAMVLALVLMVGLLGFTAVSFDLTRTHTTVERSERQILMVRAITESAVAQAVAKSCGEVPNIGCSARCLTNGGTLLKNGDRAPNQVKEGDRVLFSSYAGTDIVIDDEDLLIMSQDDILAVLD